MASNAGAPTAAATAVMAAGIRPGAHPSAMPSGSVIKKPKRPYAKGLFFVDQHGGVHREDPRQIELELTRKADIEKAGAIAFEQSQRDIDKVGRG